jgi:ligand-binding SRPBCC domain-containing protein
VPAFDWITRVAAGVEDVAEFHAAPRIIRRLTPFVVPMSMHRMDPLDEGSISEFTLWFGPIPVRWTALHVDVDPRTGFTDVQTAGPFPLWRHCHRFQTVPSGGTAIIEHVEYRHGSGWPGLLTRLLFSRPMLTLLFAYRSAVMRWSLRHAGRGREASASPHLLRSETVPMNVNPPTDYELPEAGISLLGYVIRRMHKTELLRNVPQLVNCGRTDMALASLGTYGILAATSFGEARYQPSSNPAGTRLSEADPATGTVVEACLESASPHLRIAVSVTPVEGGVFTGSETILGTTVSLRGLGMPAPSAYEYRLPEPGYSARLAGTITSELSPRLLRSVQVRGFGSLDLEDSSGNTGRVSLDRSGRLHVAVSRPDGSVRESTMDVTAGDWLRFDASAGAPREAL